MQTSYNYGALMGNAAGSALAPIQTGSALAPSLATGQQTASMWSAPGVGTFPSLGSSAAGNGYGYGIGGNGIGSFNNALGNTNGSLYGARNGNAGIGGTMGTGIRVGGNVNPTNAIPPYAANGSTAMNGMAGGASTFNGGMAPSYNTTSGTQSSLPFSAGYATQNNSSGALATPPTLQQGLSGSGTTYAPVGGAVQTWQSSPYTQPNIGTTQTGMTMASEMVKASPGAGRCVCECEAEPVNGIPQPQNGPSGAPGMFSAAQASGTLYGAASMPGAAYGAMAVAPTTLAAGGIVGGMSAAARDGTAHPVRLTMTNVGNVIGATLYFWVHGREGPLGSPNVLLGSGDVTAFVGPREFITAMAQVSCAGACAPSALPAIAWLEPLTLGYAAIDQYARVSTAPLTISVTGATSCRDDGSCSNAGVQWTLQ